MTIGQTLKTIRKKKKMKQKVFASKLGVSVKTVADWEYDRRAPSIERLKEICKVLKCSPMAFFRDKD